MDEIFQVEFLLDLESFFKNINDEQFDILIVNNVPSASKAVEVILSNQFKNHVTAREKLIGIHFKINEKCDMNFNRNLELNPYLDKEIFLVMFEFTADKNESKIYWKIKDQQRFYSLEIFEAFLGELCRKFILNEIQTRNSGILDIHQNKGVTHIREIGNSDESNLLIIAAENNQDEIVERLLKFEFDVDYKNSNELNAIDCAWLNYINEDNSEEIRVKSNKIILSLLNANSKFPCANVNFSVERASKEVQDFIEMCESLHENVEFDDFEPITEVMKIKPNLCYFYDRCNQSLMAYALKNRKTKICNYLIYGISIACHEDLGEIYEKINCRNLRNIYRQYAKDLPKEYLFTLRSKCKIGYNDEQSQNRWKHIEEAFRIMDSNESCSKVLKVAATWKKLVIYFDFMQDTVYYLDPTKSMYTRGTVYSSGIIYIGAKFLTDAEKKYEICGVIIHELCHLAINITYMNHFDPYPLGESEEKQRFIEEVIEECKTNQEEEEIVETVFECYPEEYQHSELIVTAVQMQMHYFVENVNVESKNSRAIANVSQKFEKLFKYFKEVVEPQLEKAEPILKLLINQEIRFQNLTEPMKAKVFYSKINFQGTETSLYEMIGKDPDIVSVLEPNNIVNIVTGKEIIKIGDFCEKSAKYKVVERKFSHSNMSVETIEATIERIKKSKIFLLSDSAGAGKTTIFEELTSQLKAKFNNFWVSYIKLRHHREIFDKLPNDINIQDIVEVLVKIFNLKSELEIRIFKKLFYKNRTILLLDGVDEISPNFNELVLKIIKILNQTTENQLWISTRPQHAERIENAFEVRKYASKFVPYTKEERKEFINGILNISEIAEQLKSKVLSKVNQFIKYVEDSCSDQYNIQNPLMIQIITELCIEKDLDLYNIDFYEVFESIINKQKEKIDGKVLTKDRDPFIEFSLKKVHQVFSLKLIFGDTHESKLQDLAIMRKWSRERHTWTQEKIQRYGFLSVDMSSQQNERNYIDFIHRTYAEFFVAEFILTSVFDIDNKTETGEVVKIFDILNIVINGYQTYHVIQTFLICFLRRDLPPIQYKLHEKIKHLITVEMYELCGKSINDLNNIRIFELCSLFLKQEIKVLNDFWLVGTPTNMIKKFFTVHNDIDLLCQILYLAEICFGPNWHDVFNAHIMFTNIKFKNLLKDHELGNFEAVDANFRKFNKNLFKLLELVEKNYNKKHKMLIFSNFFATVLIMYRKNIDQLVFEKFIVVFNSLQDIFVKFVIKYLQTSTEGRNNSEEINLKILLKHIDKTFKQKKIVKTLILSLEYPVHIKSLLAIYNTKK